MLDFSIGLSGLQVAQRAIELVGNNIANVATEGYHRQELRISSLPSSFSASIAIGGGSEITAVTRQMDRLLELEMLRQQPQQGQIAQQLETLKTIEGALGNVTSNALNQAISGFFNSMRELASQPDSQAFQEQVLWAGENLAGQFRNVSEFLTTLGRHVLTQASEYVEKVNSLTAEIAQANQEIQGMNTRGGNSAILRDQRDQAIAELAKLVDIRVETPNESTGQVNVLSWGTPLVMGAQATALEVRQTDQDTIGLGVKGSNYFQNDLSGGRLGGLLSLRNELLPEIKGRLDTLAAQIMGQINDLHVQGIGSAGSFTQLVGMPMSGSTVGQWQPPVTDGDFCLRLTAADGSSEIHHIAIDADVDTMDSIVAKINAAQPAVLRADIVNGCLSISTSGGYTFDFLPAVTLDEGSLALAGRPAATVHGVYTGSVNDVLTATVISGGQVGNEPNLEIEVRNQAGELVATLDVGQGYVAGEDLSFGQGIKLSLWSGQLQAGDTFAINTPADTDSAGFLASAGINTFFSGTGAMDMAVRRELFASPGRLATALGADGGDNLNIDRMADLVDRQLAELGGVTIGEHYRRTIGTVAQNIQVLETRKDAVDGIVQQLTNQRDSISGVDINEEAAKLLVFERMYQGMAKFISSQDQMMRYLMDLL